MLKSFLLIGASAAALAASSAEALTTFSYTGGFQSFTASVAGAYTIDAYGAQGGSASGLGGKGAGVGGTFTLTAGETLTIAVGGAGQANNGAYATPVYFGGGGGSFVTHGAAALLVAGGGGGDAGDNRGSGLQGTSGGTPLGSFPGQGGSNGGGGGGAGYQSGAGGAGFLGDGGSNAGLQFLYGILGGSTFPSLAGGQHGPHGPHGGGGIGGNGGFGGGGEGYNGGGGGGGFSGGGGGNGTSGGGGGSFFGGTGGQVDLGLHSGNGLVTIDLLPPVAGVPEPSSWAMMMLGFAAIGAAMRRRLLKLA